VRAFDNFEDTGPCREGLAQPDIIGEKKAWISVFVDAEDLLNSCELVRFECYRFLRGTLGNVAPFSSLWIFSSQLNCLGSNPSNSGGNA